jgi:hypothetical protein
LSEVFIEKFPDIEGEDCEKLRSYSESNLIIEIPEVGGSPKEESKEEATNDIAIPKDGEVNEILERQCHFP